MKRKDYWEKDCTVTSPYLAGLEILSRASFFTNQTRACLPVAAIRLFVLYGRSTRRNLGLYLGPVAESVTAQPPHLYESLCPVVDNTIEPGEQGGNTSLSSKIIFTVASKGMLESLTKYLLRLLPSFEVISGW